MSGSGCTSALYPNNPIARYSCIIQSIRSHAPSYAGTSEGIIVHDAVSKKNAFGLWDNGFDLYDLIFFVQVTTGQVLTWKDAVVAAEAQGLSPAMVAQHPELITGPNRTAILERLVGSVPAAAGGGFPWLLAAAGVAGIAIIASRK